MLVETDARRMFAGADSHGVRDFPTPKNGTFNEPEMLFVTRKVDLLTQKSVFSL